MTRRRPADKLRRVEVARDALFGVWWRGTREYAECIDRYGKKENPNCVLILRRPDGRMSQCTGAELRLLAEGPKPRVELLPPGAVLVFGDGCSD